MTLDEPWDAEAARARFHDPVERAWRALVIDLSYVFHNDEATVAAHRPLIEAALVAALSSPETTPAAPDAGLRAALERLADDAERYASSRALADMLPAIRQARAALAALPQPGEPT